MLGMNDSKPVTALPHVPAKRERNPGTPESVALRRIQRVLDQLEDDRRMRVVGAIQSLYYGPRERA